MIPTMAQKLVAEAIGTGFLLATIVGAGVMAEDLAGGNIAVALLGTVLPIGAILYVIITMLAPISGAHFNPAVTFVNIITRDIKPGDAVLYIAVQIISGIAAVWLVHIMFELDVMQFSGKIRYGPAQWVSEIVATFGLLTTILLTVRFKPEAVPLAVALYITAACWFTSSTSFANPAVTIARSFSNTFTGIEPGGILPFIAAQLIGAVLALWCCRFLTNGFEDEP